jgi:multiple sugar transport system substrate-binding protein
MKFAKSLLIVLAIFLALVAPALSVAAKADTKELHMTWWGSQTRHDRTIAVIELYEQQNPDIDIVYEFSGWGDYWTLLTTKASGGNLPDIMQQDYAYLHEWQSRDLLMPLDDYFASGVINVSNVSPTVLDSGKVGDEVYGLALGTNSQAVMIDTDLLEQAGLELPSPDWTWVEFEDTCLAIHEALDIWCFGGTLSDEALWKSLFLGHGLWVFNEAGTAIGYEDDQPLIEYLDMILRLMDAGALPTVEEWAEYRDLGPEGNPIVSGKAAMAYHWSNQVVAVNNAAGEGRNFKLWHLPRPEGGQPENYVKPSQFFSITTQAKYPDEAAAFIDFFTNSMEANAILAAERGVPVSSVVRDELAAALSPIEQEAFDFLARVEADSSPVPPADPAGWADIRDNVYGPQFADLVLYGEISPAEGAAYLREEANIILAKNE